MEIKINGGIFSKSDGALTHVGTGLPIAPHLSFETTLDTAEIQEFLTELRDMCYISWLHSLVDSGEYAVNMQAVARDYRSIYESVPPAPATTSTTQQKPQTELDKHFDEPPPMSEDALQAVLKVHQMTLDKNPKTAGQQVKAFYAIKALESKEGKRGLAFLDDHLKEVHTFWDNSNGDKEKSYANPYSAIKKANLELSVLLWKSDKETVFTLTRPIIVALKKNGDFVNFQRVLQFDGSWEIA